MDPDKISSIFTRETAGDEAIAPLTNLISSDLDADRIDYLLRTAHHTSLPYGAVDIDYLLTQLQIDDQNRVCLTEKALRTADHFLLCRYFDYLQVAFHKTVAGMEAVLKDVLQALINRGMIQSSGEEVIRSVESGAWCDVDDSFVIHRMRQLLEAGSVSDIEKTKVAAVLKRRPPRLLAEMEFVGPRDTGVNDFRLKLSVVRARLSDWAKQFDVDRDLWYVWNRANLALTKVGAQVPQSRRFERDGPTERLEREEYEQEIRILDARGKQSRPITEIPYSLMNVLSGQALYSLRIFALLPEKPADLRERIETEIKKDLPDIPWK